MPQEPSDTSQSPLAPPKRPNELPPGAVSDFDWMRALAAFAVLAGHVRGLYFVDYGDLPNPSVFARVSYMVTGLGHQSVIVFFVLSGFFIGYSVLASRQTGRSNPRDYAIRRFARIYVVLVPALIATFLVDSLGIELFGTARTVYGGEVNAPFLELPTIPEQLGLGALLANLFQLQSILDFPEYGTNSPLWSLSYEAWAYAIFPLGLVAHVRPLRIGTVIRIIAVLGLFIVGGELLCLYFTIWLMGAAVSWWWLRSERSETDLPVPRVVPLIALLVFLALTVIGRGRLLGSRALEDLALGVATALLIGALLKRPRAWQVGRAAKAGAWLAGFSYSLYLFHYPMVAFVHAAVLGPDRWVPTLTHTLASVGVTAGIMFAWCYPLSLVTERHTGRVRAWLAARLPGVG